MRSKRIEARLAFAQMIALACLAGCSGSKPSKESADLPETIAECDAYIASLSKCLTRAGAEATTENAREAVAARFATAAKGDEATRERFRLKCAEGQKVLASSCR